jgi:hypothetical protein
VNERKPQAWPGASRKKCLLGLDKSTIPQGARCSIKNPLRHAAIAFGYRHLCFEPQINHFVMAITAAKAMVWHVPSRELICTGELRCTPQLPSPPPL